MTSDNDAELQDEKPIRQLSIIEAFPHSLYTTPIVGIFKQSKVGTASSLLRFFLESFTDQLVVIENEKPCGVLGGADIIRNMMKTPSYDFFKSTSVEQIMQNEFLMVNEKQQLSDLIQKWVQSRRAFAIIQNGLDFFAISIRTLLDIYPFLNADLTISDIPKKKTIWFTKDQPVREILNLMFENHTRRLILKNSEYYVSDRLIIETICSDLKYLHDIDNFLDMDCSVFKLEKVKMIPRHTTIPQLFKIMHVAVHPYVMCDDQVFTPFDALTILGCDDIYSKTLRVTK